MKTFGQFVESYPHWDHPEVAKHKGHWAHHDLAHAQGKRTHFDDLAAHGAHDTEYATKILDPRYEKPLKKDETWKDRAHKHVQGLEQRAQEKLKFATHNEYRISKMAPPASPAPKAEPSQEPAPSTSTDRPMSYRMQQIMKRRMQKEAQEPTKTVKIGDKDFKMTKTDKGWAYHDSTLKYKDAAKKVPKNVLKHDDLGSLFNIDIAKSR